MAGEDPEACAGGGGELRGVASFGLHSAPVSAGVEPIEAAWWRRRLELTLKITIAHGSAFRLLAMLTAIKKRSYKIFPVIPLPVSGSRGIEFLQASNSSAN
ncbi:hypothetical protein ABZP36_002898 [Zizania latifolia]